jgi:hypothetical protein
VAVKPGERIKESEFGLTVEDSIAPVIAAGDGEESWVDVCADKVYVPQADDVGCILRIEVFAVSAVDGSIFSGPMVVYSDHVLAAPRPPPKRNLIAIPGALSGLSNSIRFRVISYNILAELYATKNVSECVPACLPLK